MNYNDVYVTKCSSCNTDGFLYEVVCRSCGNTLRDKIPNIDLWNTLYKLIYSPSEAFQIIIQASVKILILPLYFIFPLKVAILFLLFASNLFGVESLKFSTSYVGALSFTVFFPVLIYLIYTLTKGKKRAFRLKDCLAIVAFSLLPITISLFIFFPLEIVIFGQYFFSAFPTPFEINNQFAWLFATVELILIVWTLLLLTIGFRILSGMLLFAFCAMLFFILLFSTTLYLIINLL